MINSNWKKKLITSALLLTFSTVVTAPAYAESMNDMKNDAGISTDLDSENLGGGLRGNGVGNPTGDSALDDINNAKCINPHIIGTKMITDTCWTCMFPIVTAGMALGASKNETPEDRDKSITCMCDDIMGVPQPGFVYGLWVPGKLMEFTRTPGCLMTLGGVSLNFSKIGQGQWGNNANPEYNDDPGAHYRTYAYPLMVMLNMFEKMECLKDHYADIDLLFISEVDPTWYNDEIAFFTNPEAVFLSNPIGELACVPDALAATALKRPISSLFWCAGAWGSMYPFTTNSYGAGGGVRFSSLMSARILSVQHRRFFLKKTYGDDALCKSTMAFYIPKPQYKYTMLYPVPEKRTSHVIGENTLFWGSNREIPVTGEDFIYLLWTWNDCCMPLADK